MAINKKLIHFKTKSNFLKELDANNILETSICFIKDTREIWTHNTFYAAPADLDDYATEEWIKSLNFLTEKDIANLATKDELDNKANKDEIVSLPEEGAPGQILTKTTIGSEWRDFDATGLKTIEGWDFNMDQCLETGIYPWCATGRPNGSTGHYTLFVQRSATPDANDYYTVEQTAFGREGDTGKVYKRIIFVKDGYDLSVNKVFEEEINSSGTLILETSNYKFELRPKITLSLIKELSEADIITVSINGETFRLYYNYFEPSDKLHVLGDKIYNSWEDVNSEGFNKNMIIYNETESTVTFIYISDQQSIDTQLIIETLKDNNGLIDFSNSWVNCTGGVNKLAFSGIIKADDESAETTITNTLNSLNNNEQAWFIIGNKDNHTKKEDGNEGWVKLSDFLANLVHLENSRGVAANLGDFLCVAKDANGNPLYHIIPVNDSKAPSDDNTFPGTYGILTPNDRMDMDNAMMLTYGEQNMNEALKSGFYPWCTTGRPEGSEGAYTCVVQRSRQVDNNGFFSVMQTAFGRQGTEEGEVYQRVIFYKPSNRAEDNYGKWIKVNNLDMKSLWSNDANTALNSGVYGWVTENVPEYDVPFTILTKRSTNADGNGYYTIELTAYSRDGQDKIYKRIFFQKEGEYITFSAWKNISYIDILNVEFANVPDENNIITLDYGYLVLNSNSNNVDFDFSRGSKIKVISKNKLNFINYEYNYIQSSVPTKNDNEYYLYDIELLSISENLYPILPSVSIDVKVVDSIPDIHISKQSGTDIDGGIFFKGNLIKDIGEYNSALKICFRRSSINNKIIIIEGRLGNVDEVNPSGKLQYIWCNPSTSNKVYITDDDPKSVASSEFVGGSTEIGTCQTFSNGAAITNIYSASKLGMGTSEYSQLIYTTITNNFYMI